MIARENALWGYNTCCKMLIFKEIIQRIQQQCQTLTLCARVTLVSTSPKLLPYRIASRYNGLGSR